MGTESHASAEIKEIYQDHQPRHSLRHIPETYSPETYSETFCSRTSRCVGDVRGGVADDLRRFPLLLLIRSPLFFESPDHATAQSGSMREERHGARHGPSGRPTTADASLASLSLSIGKKR